MKHYKEEENLCATLFLVGFRLYSFCLFSKAYSTVYQFLLIDALPMLNSDTPQSIKTHIFRFALHYRVKKVMLKAASTSNK